MEYVSSSNVLSPCTDLRRIICSKRPSLGRWLHPATIWVFFFIIIIHWLVLGVRTRTEKQIIETWTVQVKRFQIFRPRWQMLS